MEHRTMNGVLRTTTMSRKKDKVVGVVMTLSRMRESAPNGELTMETSTLLVALSEVVAEAEVAMRMVAEEHALSVETKAILQESAPMNKPTMVMEASPEDQ